VGSITYYGQSLKNWKVSGDVHEYWECVKLNVCFWFSFLKRRLGLDNVNNLFTYIICTPLHIFLPLSRSGRHCRVINLKPYPRRKHCVLCLSILSKRNHKIDACSEQWKTLQACFLNTHLYFYLYFYKMYSVFCLLFWIALYFFTT
jgi:hypothetical protein